MSKRNEIVRLWQKGLTYQEIAMEVRASRSAVAGHVYRHRRGCGVSDPTRTPAEKTVPVPRRYRKRQRGPNLATDPATRDIVDAIARSHLYDWEIAERVGLERETIRRWRNGTHKARAFLIECVKEVLSNECNDSRP